MLFGSAAGADDIERNQSNGTIFSRGDSKDSSSQAKG